MEIEKAVKGITTKKLTTDKTSRITSKFIVSQKRAADLPVDDAAAANYEIISDEVVVPTHNDGMAEKLGGAKMQHFLLRGGTDEDVI
jgi:hypothetical protein